jgi:hypothetical protein
MVLSNTGFRTQGGGRLGRFNECKIERLRFLRRCAWLRLRRPTACNGHLGSVGYRMLKAVGAHPCHDGTLAGHGCFNHLAKMLTRSRTEIAIICCCKPHMMVPSSASGFPEGIMNVHDATYDLVPCYLAGWLALPFPLPH